ncbi:MAG: hypothetical protein AAB646_02990 [Patescibacteria group bacterium]
MSVRLKAETWGWSIWKGEKQVGASVKGFGQTIETVLRSLGAKRWIEVAGSGACIATHID